MKARRFDQKAWEGHFLKIYNYYLKYGKYPTFDDVENNGRWLITQRLFLRQGKLDLMRKHMLDTAMPDWFNGNKKSNWIVSVSFEEHLNVVKKYYLEKGVFPGATDKENDGKWLVTQRYLFNSGKLSKNRKKMLDDNLPNWLVFKQGKIRDDWWNENLEKVKKYYLKNGVLPVTNDYENGGNWLYRQRVELKEGNLGEYRIKILDATIPFWKNEDINVNDFNNLEEVKLYYKKLSLTNHINWILRLENVKNYYDQTGVFPKLADEENDGVWLVHQRYLFKQGKLGGLRKKILDKFLPGWNVYKKKVKKIENNEQINSKVLVRKN